MSESSERGFTLYPVTPPSDLTPEQQWLLVSVMEEAAELSHAAAKILRFGPHSCHPRDETQTMNVALLRRERDDLARTLRALGEPIPATFAQQDAPRPVPSVTLAHRLEVLRDRIAQHRPTGLLSVDLLVLQEAIDLARAL